MKRLIRFSMRNGVVILILMLIVIGMGIQSVQQMSMEKYPNVDIPYLTVIILYPGASPELAMDEIGKPLENELRKIDGIEKMYTSGWVNGFSATLQFGMEENMTEAERRVKDAVAKVNLPKESLTPRYIRAQPDNPEIYTLGVFAEGVNTSVQAFVDDTLLPKLKEVKGINEINVTGNEVKNIEVRVKTDALKTHHLTIDQVKQALIANNLSVPTGEITVNEQRLPIRLDQKITSLESLKKMNLLIVQQDFSSMEKSFTQIGNGMEELGKGITSVGNGLSSLGQLQQLQATQIQLLAAMQGMSGTLLKDQSTLQTLMSKPVQDEATAREIAALKQKIAAEEGQIASLQKEFAAVTEQMKQAGASYAPPTAGGKAQTPQGGTEGIRLSVKAVPLEEIADISHATDPQSTTARVNGKPAVTIGILPESGQNIVNIVAQIESRLQAITPPAGIRIETLRNQSVEIESSVYAMLKEALLGGLMAVIVTLLFLRNLRSTLIAILSIPLSVLASFILLQRLGYTLNIVTLSGIAVAVGRVVDDSIVVIENIFRRLRKTTERSHRIIEESTMEVAGAITSSTLTTVAVFLPLAFIPGIVGKFFTPLAWTIVISLIFSLLVAITVVPLLSRTFLLRMKPVEEREGRLKEGYRRLLGWGLNHRLLTLGIALLLLVASIALIVPRLGFNFLPQDEMKDYDVQITMEPGSTKETTDRVTVQAERILLQHPELEKVTSAVENEGAKISFSMKKEVPGKKELAQRLRQEFAKVTGAKEILLTGIGAVGGGQTNELILVVNGPTPEAMKEASEKMIPSLTSVSGLADVHATSEGLKPELNLRLDSQKMADHALYPGMVGISLRNMVAGEEVTRITLDGKESPVLLKQDLSPIHTTQDLEKQKVANMVGDEIAIDQIGTLELVKKPEQITRLNQKEYVMISGTITDPNTGKVVQEAEAALNKLTLPEGVTWYKEGASEAMAEGFQNMGYALLLSVLLIYMVMVVAFGEPKAPFVILFAIPFSAIGALVGLLIVQEPIGMPAMIGLLMLNGIVVTNAIVLIDRVKQNERRGLTTREALLEAGATRLRPILMTAIATIGALIPMSFSKEAGIISSSLATVVIGGLTTSTLLTLLIVPILYSFLHARHDREKEGAKEQTGAD